MTTGERLIKASDLATIRAAKYRGRNRINKIAIGLSLAAMAVGWLYGRNKRVWCKYLCPVNGVFNLLARLAPWHFAVDAQAWRTAPRRTETINCAPLLPLRTMEGAAECHMCGRCSDYRGAIALEARSPEAEIVGVAPGNGWETALSCSA